MDTAVVVLGCVVEVGAWRLVASAGRSVWGTMVPALVVMAAAAITVRAPSLSPAVDLGVAAVGGVGAGVVLYLATRAFVFVVRDWRTFREQALAMYARQAGVPKAIAVLLAAGVIASGEELFWRGFVQPRLGEALGARPAGAAVAWLVFVAANLASRNLAIVAGAVVGGAAWTGLALWTHGVLASLLCHGVWTALMLAFPVLRAPAGGAPA